MGNVKREVVTMTVDALHILEEVAQEDEIPYGMKLGGVLIHGLLMAVASRAAELDDPQLNILMLKLHLFEIDDIWEEIRKQEEMVSKKGAKK